MNALFLACFIGGLLLAVRVMLFGIERTASTPAEPRLTLRLSLPVLAGFLAVFGATGYLLARTTALGVVPILLAALAGGTVAAVLAGWLARTSAAMVPEFDIDDERYVLQGLVARVTTPIAASGDGEIAFEVGSVRRVLRARGVDGLPVESGTEVVIERIEDDVAYVEPWLQVEKRL